MVPWKLYRTGNALWVWWADSAGGKVRQRLCDDQGVPPDSDVSPREANRAAAEAYDEWCRLADGEAPRKKEALTLGSLQREYAEANEINWHERTIYDTALYMRTLERYFGAECDPRAITPRELEKFKRWLLEEGGARGGPLASTTADNRFQHGLRLFTAFYKKA